MQEGRGGWEEEGGWGRGAGGFSVTDLTITDWSHGHLEERLESADPAGSWEQVNLGWIALGVRKALLVEVSGIRSLT